MRRQFLLLAIVILGLSSYAQKVDNTSQNKKFARDYVSALNQKNWAEKVKPFFTPTDYNQFKTDHGKFRVAFPDYHFTIDMLVAQGDSVVIIGTATATHSAEFPVGEFKGVAPTGKYLQWKELWVCRITNGKFGESWMMTDNLTRMKQLGIRCLPE
jgi:predicted ester cyclase